MKLEIGKIVYEGSIPILVTCDQPTVWPQPIYYLPSYAVYKGFMLFPEGAIHFQRGLEQHILHERTDMFEGYILNGFIGMSNGDMGDALQKTTLIAVIERRSKIFIPEHNEGKDNTIISRAEVSPGIYVRYPDAEYETAWMADPATTSRDQISSAVIWMGYAMKREMLQRQWNQQCSRWGFYQNTVGIWPKPTDTPKKWWQVDFWSPEHIMQYVRSHYMIEEKGWGDTNFHFKKWLLQFVMCFTDLFMLGNVMVILTMGYLDADFSDDDNAILSMLQAKDIMDTPTAKLARWLYGFRPIAGYVDEEKTKTLRSLGKPIPGSAVLWKHRGPLAPPIGKFMVEVGVFDEF